MMRPRASAPASGTLSSESHCMGPEPKKRAMTDPVSCTPAASREAFSAACPVAVSGFVIFSGSALRERVSLSRISAAPVRTFLRSPLMKPVRAWPLTPEAVVSSRCILTASAAVLASVQ